MTIRPNAAASLLAIAAFAPAAGAQTDYDWINPSGGQWTLAANWSPSSNFPRIEGDTATIGLATAFNVNVGQSVDLTRLSITNADASVTIQTGLACRVFDTVTNDGVILINETANVFDASVFFVVGATTPVGGHTLDGSGRIVLGAVSDFGDAQVIAGAGATVTHAASHTIEGVGQINGAFINNGLISANVPASIGIQVLDTVDQSGGGVLRADGGNIALSSAHVIGGTLESSPGSSVTVSNDVSTLSGGAHVTGSITIPGSSRALDLAGPVTVDGLIDINSSLQVFNASLRFADSVTLSGAAEILLRLASADTNDARIEALPGFTGTLGPSVDIHGAGRLVGDLVLQGSLDADSPGELLEIIDTLTVAPGAIVRATGGQLGLNAATVVNANFDSSAGGRVRTSAGSSLLDGPATNSGTLAVLGAPHTLEVNDALTNNGVIEVNPDLTVFNAALLFSGTPSVVGTGQIHMSTAGTDTNDARIATVTGVTATLGAGQVITGSGRIEGDFNSDARIEATHNSFPLEIRANVTQGSGVIAADNAVLGLVDASITGGSFESSNAGIVASTFGLNNIITDITNNGDLGVHGAPSVLMGAGTIVNNGRILINDNLQVFNAAFVLTGTPSIVGSGQIILTTAGTDTNDARMATDTGVTATLGAGQVISGFGRIDGDYFSDARIEATSPTISLELRANITQGSGVIAADNAVLGFVDASITGGSFESSNGGIVASIFGLNNTITDITNNGDLGVHGAPSVMTASGTIVNNGRIRINDNVQVFNAALLLEDTTSITGNGEINLTLAGADFQDARLEVPAGSATIGAGQAVTGSGRIVGSLTIQGAIKPGVAGVGHLQCNAGTVTRAGTSAYEVEILAAGGASHDRITGDADHVLAGSLSVTELPGYIPVVGDEFVIIAGTTITGEFDSVTFPATLPNRVYRLFYESNRVLLVYTCEGDFAPPYDALDFSDVLAFLAAFGSGDSLADLAPPFGVFDFSDVIAFLTAFGTGCP